MMNAATSSGWENVGKWLLASVNKNLEAFSC
jgi:hypothetical protein